MNTKGAPSRAQRKVTNNTIIYSTVRPRLKHYGILSRPQNNFIVSTGFTTIDIKDLYKDKIDPQYSDLSVCINLIIRTTTRICSYPNDLFWSYLRIVFL